MQSGRTHKLTEWDHRMGPPSAEVRSALIQSTPYFFKHSVKNRATFQRPATHARNIVYAYD